MHSGFAYGAELSESGLGWCRKWILERIWEEVRGFRGGD